MINCFDRENFLSFLTSSQQTCWLKFGYVNVLSNAEHWWRVYSHMDNFNIVLRQPVGITYLDRWNTKVFIPQNTRVCAAPYGNWSHISKPGVYFTVMEVELAQIFKLKSDEERFLKIANVDRCFINNFENFNNERIEVHQVEMTKDRRQHL